MNYGRYESKFKQIEDAKKFLKGLVNSLFKQKSLNCF